MLAVPDVSKLLVGIPKGAWVALSNDQQRVLAYAAELQDAIQKAAESGEGDPVVLRIPEADATTLLV